MSSFLKSAAIIAALGLSGAAVAQTTTVPANPPGNTEAAKGGALAGAAGGAAVGAVVGGPVGAVVGGIVGAATGGIAGSLTPEDTQYAKTYVMKQKHDNIVVTEPLTVGKPLPGTVKVYTIDGYDRLSGYRYTYVNNQYLLIDKNGNIIGALQ